MMVCVLMMSAHGLNAATYTVGHGSEYDFNTITSSLNSADSGDTILVDSGTYKATNTTYPESFPIIMKEGVILKSVSDETVPTIDAEQTTFVFNCSNLGTGLGTTIQGFIITGGYVSIFDPVNNGAGVHVSRSELNLINCRVTDNVNEYDGGGLAAYESSVYLKNCAFQSNQADYIGGGILNSKGQLTIDNCRITDNIGGEGGGILQYQVSSLTMINSIVSDNYANSMGGLGIIQGSRTVYVFNCVFSGNYDNNYAGGVSLNGTNASQNHVFSHCTFKNNSTEHGEGGGVLISSDFEEVFTNCIFWNNAPSQMGGDTDSATVTYSDVQGGFPGTGNIDVDPYFAVGTSGDFYLAQIAAGQTADSPCVNAGSDLASNISFAAGDNTYTMNQMSTRTDSEPDTGQVDMGFHLFSSSSSPTPTPAPTPTPECTKLGCSIEMPSNMFGPGNHCYCTVYVCNPGQTTYKNTPVFVVLDVYGLYFFAPSFSDFDSYLFDIAPGIQIIEVLPSFNWPSGAGSATGIYWYAAMTDPEMTGLIGNMDTFAFGWYE
jgi:hypothetical protein